MKKEQIHEIFKLIRKSKPNARQNIRTLYLDRIGNEIIPYCKEHFLDETKAEVRNDLIRFVIQYAQSDDRTFELAKLALKDKSKKVKESGLAIFAYSGNKKYIDFLKKNTSILTNNSDDLKRALEAINYGNHNLYYPQYATWTISLNDIKRHLKTKDFREDIDFYIKKHSKESIPELERILGTLYC